MKRLPAHEPRPLEEQMAPILEQVDHLLFSAKPIVEKTADVANRLDEGDRALAFRIAESQALRSFLSNPFHRRLVRGEPD